MWLTDTINRTITNDVQQFATRRPQIMSTPQPTRQLPIMDTLEQRRMLSATLVKGVLTVTGTDGDDTITVMHDVPKGKNVSVNVNGDVSLFKARAVKRIIVDGGAGNDTITISDANGVVGGKHLEIGG